MEGPETGPPVFRPSPDALHGGAGLQPPGAVFDRRRQDGGRGCRTLCLRLICRGCALISQLGILWCSRGLAGESVADDPMGPHCFL